MAFTALSQRVRGGRVPIAFSDMPHCAISVRTGLLGSTLVVFREHPSPVQEAQYTAKHRGGSKNTIH